MQQLNDTEVLMEQLHMLTPKQQKLKDKLLKQMVPITVFKLSILKGAPKKDLAQIILSISNVLQTLIGKTNNLMYSTALLLTENLGYEVKCKARIP